MAKKNKKPEIRATIVSSSAPVEFNPDYSNTKKDLTRIGVLAGSFFVLLIVLSFFIK